MKDSLEITKEAVVHMVPVMEAEGLEELASLASENGCQSMLEVELRLPGQRCIWQNRD